jgi:tetratricopeptide (TPR) repeat protein/2-polyprenyl-3-methyl-5-hydroxy-6-metoxy-1,4-benzoquinol methylase
MAKNKAKRPKKLKPRKKGSKPQNVPEELKAMLSQALSNHQSGLMDQAILVYRQVLAVQPDFADANHLLGIALHHRGELEEAVGLIKKAIKSVPGRAAFHSNLGNALKDVGRIDEAVASFRKALVLDSEHANAHINLGNVLNQLGRYDESGPHLQKAIRLQPDSPEAHNNLGLMLHEGQHQLNEAVSSFNKALSLRPDFPEAHYNLGNVLSEQFCLDDAVVSFQKALSLRPGYTEAHINLGNAFKEQNKLEEAVRSYRKAIEIDPKFLEILYSLGLVYMSLGHVDDAFSSLRKAVRENPQDGKAWGAWAECLAAFPFASVDDDLFEDLTNMLDQPAVSPRPLANPILRALRKNPEFSKILEFVNDNKTAHQASYREVAEKLSAIPLLIKLMGLCSFDDLEIENTFTSLRRLMIGEVLDEKVQESGLAFAAALANQCFANEYVYSESSEEKIAVDGLEKRLMQNLEDNLDVPPFWVAAMGAYRALHSFSWADKLLEREWPDGVQTVITRQVVEPNEEHDLRLQMPHITPIDGEVSKAVRAQYEANPYPRWIKTGLRESGLPIGKVLRQIQLPINFARYNFPENPKILIAGCGTGQHAISTASRFSNSRVSAVDLSLSSLGYAARKTRELGLSNIDYGQGDILELASMKRQFDIIESAGVLHHLQEPLAGWRVLVDMLHPDGLMMIGLYSETARRSIVQARALIAVKGYSSSPEGIRECRQDIIEMSKGVDNEISKIPTYTDFYSLSDCRDLIFHVQEHRFTLPQIEDALQDFGLEFLGFEIHDQAVLRAFREANPQQDALGSLSAWHEFELANADTFVGMYQFWCRKKA